MNVDEVVNYTSQALVLCLVISLPAVGASAFIGLAVAFVQAVTSLQDQSIGYAVKLLVVGGALAVSAPWSGAQLVHFSKALMAVAFRPASQP